MKEVKQILLFVMMAILFLGGLPLLLGEMQDFTLLAFLLAKLTGFVFVVLGYFIYRHNFRQVED